MPRGRRVTLTFDNGPTPGVTDQVLDILAERSLRAIFFVVANRVDGDAAARALLTRMVRDCHRVGNHSLTHGHPLGELSEQETIAEIATAHDILREFTGEKSLFRPWGTEGQLDRRCLNGTAVNYLVSGKHTCVLWHSVPRDWADPIGWIDRALADVRAREHTLVVIHDLPSGAMDGLPRFLDELDRSGVAVTAELPTECVPIIGGRIVGAVDHLMPL
ncbi:MAG: peptidoglycan-N-acetylglucosamine deacetylase [Mycobacterium sp.]|nr:peptidoglycan-N-acetylglucosamine deacetylase [Mycobacterium sp.]